jgi:hypothetical protein
MHIQAYLTPMLLDLMAFFLKLLNTMMFIFHISYIFDQFYLQKVFPKILKSALVTPVYKRGHILILVFTDHLHFIFSKLLEKLHYNRLTAFIEKYEILHSNQYEFRNFKSTSIAGACVLNSLLSECFSNTKTIVTLLDLMSAFIFINHDLLLGKLKPYELWGAPHLWLMRYLIYRSQKVKANNILSDVKIISAGVPQGLIFGPLLCIIIFINDVFQFCS